MSSNNKIYHKYFVVYFREGHNPSQVLNHLLRYLKNYYGRDSFRIVRGYEDSEISKFAVVGNSDNERLAININANFKSMDLSMIILADNNYVLDMAIQNIESVIKEYAEQIQEIRYK